MINIDKYESIVTHWITLHIHDNKVRYFDSSGAAQTPKEIKKIHRD